MTANSASVDICVATYKRTEMLRNLLNSLQAHLKGQRLIVIDNDQDGSAREVVDSFVNSTGISALYEIEPQKNIALSRNRALSLATADYIAFIDDDETASDEWLDQLVATAREYQADIVFGPSVPVYPRETPNWIIKLGCFEVERSPTGSARQHGSTSNVLIHRESLMQTWPDLFDPDYGLTGGSDTELFYRLDSLGYKLIWCDKAIAYEHVHPGRLNLAWILKRSFRGGQTIARVLISRKSAMGKAWWLIKRTIVISAAILVPVIIIFSRTTALRLLIRLSGTLGQLTGSTNYLYREYAK